MSIAESADLVYNELSPILTGACTAAALMLVEHILARRLDFRVRYVLGMLAFLVGFAVWAWRIGDWRPWRAAALIALSGGIIIVGYLLRWVAKQELGAAHESGRIEGRVQEANRGTTGIARTRDD